MTRSGLEKRMAEAVLQSGKNMSHTSRSSIGPHTFRHTTAMHLLEAGVDISVIARWLGHESIEMTNIYITSSMELKEKALASLQAPEVTARRFSRQGSTSRLSGGAVMFNMPGAPMSLKQN